ncbi:2'-5' RNA ligase family protein [Bradyrhizobium sp. 2TAF24]|uniref:2'-5' RNA ligase family protein n=1 Tax=Bradyrhizobium sp. 2TAF24 TaxID=3233011 RepID=UPI003F935DA0
MAYAISLLLDDNAADRIRWHWQLLAATGLSRSMLELGYAPHLTLAVCDQLDVAAAEHALEQLFAGRSVIDVALTVVETFAASGVIFAALAESAELRQLQAEVVAALPGAVRPDYQPHAFTPHVTLATGLSPTSLQLARQLFEQYWGSFAGRCEIAELAEFVPVTSLRRWVLAPARPSSRTP